MILIIIVESHDAIREQWNKDNPDHTFPDYVKCLSCCGDLGEVLSDLYDMSKCVNEERKDHLKAFLTNVKYLFRSEKFKRIRCGTFKKP